MPDAKIEVKVGAVSFTGEGTESWLSTQLDKIIKHIPDLVKVAPVPQGDGGGAGGASAAATQGKRATGTLAAYLTSKKVSGSQARKFLATALFLQDGGNEHLTTNSVTKALDDNKQGKLTNASQCLADNIKQGYCEKRGKREFYVTEDGRTELG
jgi:hypothetical protein